MINIIILIVSVLLIWLGLNNYSRFTSIKKKGIRSEGVIFDLTRDAVMNLNYPVIRFVTDKSEWITEKYNVGLPWGFYKRGKKVNVMYDPENPKRFIIDSAISNLASFAVMIIGLLLILFSLFSLLL